MNRFPYKAGVVIFLALCLMPALGYGQRLYRWVDENGNIHYSDRVEASSSQQNTERINSSGIRVGDQQHSAVPKTVAEQRQRQEERRQAQLDAILVQNYANELELLRAHDESRTSMEVNIRTTENSIRRLEHDLAEHSSNGTASLHAERIRTQLQQERERLERMRKNRFDLHEQQNAEVIRYRKLTAMTNEGG